MKKSTFYIMIYLFLFLSIATSQDHRNFKGQIGNKYEIEISLNFYSDNSIDGSFWYTIKKIPVKLKGYKDNDKIFFSSIDPSVKDSFNGYYDKSMITGEWTNEKRDLKFTVYATEKSGLEKNSTNEQPRKKTEAVQSIPSKEKNEIKDEGNSATNNRNLLVFYDNNKLLFWFLIAAVLIILLVVILTIKMSRLNKIVKNINGTSNSDHNTYRSPETTFYAEEKKKTVEENQIGNMVNHKPNSEFDSVICHSCNSANITTSKFCSSCGVALKQNKNHFENHVHTSKIEESINSNDKDSDKNNYSPVALIVVTWILLILSAFPFGLQVNIVISIAILLCSIFLVFSKNPAAKANGFIILIIWLITFCIGFYLSYTNTVRFLNR